MKRIVIAREAQKELREGLLFYAQRSVRAASQFADDFEKALNLIRAFPNAWPAYVENTRHCKFSRFPHALIYRQDPKIIRVIAVAHLSRRMGYWKIRH